MGLWLGIRAMAMVEVWVVVVTLDSLFSSVLVYKKKTDDSTRA
jgi:hypothetical protein